MNRMPVSKTKISKITGTISKENIQKLVESEERYRLMIEYIKDYAILLLDMKGNVTISNKGSEKIFGYTEEEFKNMHYSKLFTTEDINLRIPTEELRSTARLGKVEREGWRRKKNGVRFWADTTTNAIFGARKNLLGFSTLIRDITERKRTEVALKERTRDLEITKNQIEFEKAQDEALLESIGEGVVATDNRGRIMFMNKQAEDMFSVLSIETQKKYFYDVWTTWDENDEVVENKDCPVNKVLRINKKIVDATCMYSSKRRKKFPAAITVSPVVFGGEILGSIIVFRDIRKEKEIDRAKSEFVSLASHQLRTPLTAIKLFVEMLTSGLLGGINGSQAEILDSINESNEKMIQLVEDLLNISRLESQKLVTDTICVDLGTVVNDTVNSSEMVAELRLRKLVYKKPKMPISVVTDVNLLNQVLHNLISNSIQYTKPHKAKIEIIVKRLNSKSCCFIVKDNGIGIPKDAYKKIFLKLYRADNAIKERTEGNGLGLYMCKMIVESLGGKIWFTSREGRGTSFYVQLPIKK